MRNVRTFITYMFCVEIKLNLVSLLAGSNTEDVCLWQVTIEVGFVQVLLALEDSGQVGTAGNKNKIRLFAAG